MSAPWIVKGLAFQVYGLGTAPPEEQLDNIIMRLYIALNRTPNIDSYWVGAVPNLWSRFEVKGSRIGV